MQDHQQFARDLNDLITKAKSDAYQLEGAMWAIAGQAAMFEATLRMVDNVDRLREELSQRLLGAPPAAPEPLPRVMRNATGADAWDWPPAADYGYTGTERGYRA